MKKILSFRLLAIAIAALLCGTSNAQIILNSDINVASQRSVDGKQYHVVGNKHYPYKDTANFLSTIPKTRRHVGEISYIFNSDSSAINIWQFVGGIENNNLVNVSALYYKKPEVDSIIDNSMVKDITWGVIDSIRNAPSSPIQGDRYLVSTSATGTFAGKQNLIATYDTTAGWQFQSATQGDLLFNSANYNTYKWTGSTWALRPPLPFNNWWRTSINRPGFTANGIYGATNPYSAFLKSNGTSTWGIGTQVFEGSNRLGSDNIAIGATSQHHNWGDRNISLGTYSLWYGVSGHDQIAIGYHAAQGGDKVYSIGLGTEVGNRNRTLSISDSTTGMYMKLDTTGTAPKWMIGRNDNGFWNSYRLSNIVTQGGSGVFIPISEKGQPNGVPDLDGSGKVPLSQLPQITTNAPTYVQTLSQMLAQSSVVGDLTVVADSSKTYALTQLPANQFSNWLELKAPLPSTTDQLPEGTNNKYYTDARSRAVLSGVGRITYNNSNGQIGVTAPDWSTPGDILNKPTIPAELTPMGSNTIEITGTVPNLVFDTKNIYTKTQTDSIAALYAKINDATSTTTTTYSSDKINTLISASGGGDMLKSVYDPTSRNLPFLPIADTAAMLANYVPFDSLKAIQSDYLITKSTSGIISAKARLNSGLPDTSGVDAASVIQFAINKLTPKGAVGTGGGKIHIGSGVYNLSAQLNINGWEDGNPVRDLVIEGEGKQTLLSQWGDSANAIFINNNCKIGLTDFRISIGGGARSGIRLASDGDSSEISVMSGYINNIDIESQVTSGYPAFWATNFFGLSIPNLDIYSFYATSMRLENKSTTTNFGNSHFGKISLKAPNNDTTSALEIVSNNNYHMNLNTFDYLLIGGTDQWNQPKGRGIYINGGVQNNFNYVDIEYVKYPVWIDGNTTNGIYSTDNYIQSGYIGTSDNGTTITVKQHAGGNIFRAYLEGNNNSIQIVTDSATGQAANDYYLTLGSFMDTAKIDILNRDNSIIRLKRNGGGLSTFEVPDVNILDTSLKAANTKFVQANNWWRKNGNNMSYNNGSIGLGTDNPSQVLDVIGKIRASNGYTFGNGSSLLEIAGGQTALSSYNPLQINGAAGSNWLTPANVAMGGFTSVIMPNTDAAKNILGLYGASTQQGDYLQARNNTGDTLVRVTNLGKVIAPSMKIGGLNYPTSDGTNGQVIKTDGNGNLTFGTVSGGTGSNNPDSLANYAGADYLRKTEAAITYEPIFSKNTAFNKNFGTLAGTVSEGNHTHTFASLTSKPTTISGYGITDGITKSQLTDSLNARMQGDTVAVNTPLHIKHGAKDTLYMTQASGTDSGWITPANFNNWNGKIGGTVGSGQVAFGNGTGLSGDNGLYWDNSNKRLGIGTITPSEKLDVVGNAKVSGTLKVGAYTLPSTDGTSGQVLQTNGTGAVTWQTVSGGGGTTNLALGTATSTTQPITNSNGTGVTLPSATTSVAGLMSAADKQMLTTRQGRINSVYQTIATFGTTLTLADTSKLFADNITTAIGTYVVPPNSSVAFPINTQITFAQMGNFQTAIVAGSGVTIVSTDNALKTLKKGSTMTLIKVATDTWLLTGSITN